MRTRTLLCTLFGVAALSGVATARDVGTITVTSPAFTNGGAIPRDYTCEGRSVSPPISWTAVPPDARSIVVIVDDPDAPGGTFEHMVAYNLPPSQRSLPSAGAQQPATTGMVARNSAGSTGFAPICPPSGVHHYRFQVLALDTTINRSAGGTTSDIASATNGHVIARGQLTGTYQKTGH
jgi:Raf kinase inhibitor-like YbhB/YbcL family protein